MSDLGQALVIALRLIGTLDPELVGIVTLSLRVSLTATAIAFLIGAPAGAFLATTRLPGRTAAIVLANALLGLPPVVMGLIVYLLLSRSGPLGWFGLLFTPTAMIIAQACLAIPIVVALVHRTSDSLWSRYGDVLAVDGASPLGTIRELLVMGRSRLLTAELAALGRAIAQVGAILIGGGDMPGEHPTLNTTNDV